MQIRLGQTTLGVGILMVSSSDHTTPATGLTPTVVRSKNWGAFGALAGTVAEVADGWYAVTLAAGDVDTLGELALHATASGADPADRLVEVVAVPLIEHGTVVAGSTASIVTVSGLPSGANYVGQRLYRAATGESKAIQSQSYSSPNYTFTLGSGTGTAGPFGSAPSAGEVVGIPN